MLCEQLLCHKSFSLNNFCDVSSGIREVQCQPWFESFGDAVVRIITSIFVLLKKKKKGKGKLPKPRTGCTQRSARGRLAGAAAASPGASHAAPGGACPHVPQRVGQARWAARPHRPVPGSHGPRPAPQAWPAPWVLATCPHPAELCLLQGATGFQFHSAPALRDLKTLPAEVQSPPCPRRPGVRAGRRAR